MTMTQDLIDFHTAINMDLEPQCEHPMHQRPTGIHSGPAAYIILRKIECCEFKPGVMLLCARGWETGKRLHCPTCRTIYTRDEAWKLLEVL